MRMDELPPGWKGEVHRLFEAIDESFDIQDRIDDYRKRVQIIFHGEMPDVMAYATPLRKLPAAAHDRIMCALSDFNRAVQRACEECGRGGLRATFASGRDRIICAEHLEEGQWQ